MLNLKYLGHGSTSELIIQFIGVMRCRTNFIQTVDWDNHSCGNRVSEKKIIFYTMFEDSSLIYLKEI